MGTCSEADEAEATPWLLLGFAAPPCLPKEAAANWARHRLTGRHPTLAECMLARSQCASRQR